MLTTLVTAYHQHAVGVRRAGAWLGAALLLLAATLASLPDCGVTQTQLELLTWSGGALGGAVLLPEATRALQRWLSTGGGVALVVAAQLITAHWPGQTGAAFLAAPNVARASIEPPITTTESR